MRRPENEPDRPPPMDDILLDALLWAFPVYLVLQGYTAWTWEGGWRLAALAPLLVMVPLVAFAILAAAAQSNLFPLFVIFAAPPAVLYLAILGGVRLLVR
jgi:hypothetical protein